MNFRFQVLPGRFPLARNPCLTFRPVEGGIQRSVPDLQQVIAGPLDVLGDLVAMSGAKDQSFQDQHVERPLQQLDSVGGFVRQRSAEILPRDFQHRIDVLPSDRLARFQYVLIVSRSRGDWGRIDSVVVDERSKFEQGFG